MRASFILYVFLSLHVASSLRVSTAKEQENTSQEEGSRLGSGFGYGSGSGTSDYGIWTKKYGTFGEFGLFGKYGKFGKYGAWGKYGKFGKFGVDGKFGEEGAEASPSFPSAWWEADCPSRCEDQKCVEMIERAEMSETMMDIMGPPPQNMDHGIVVEVVDPAMMGGMHLKAKQNHTTGAKPEFGLKVKQQNPMWDMIEENCGTCLEEMDGCFDENCGEPCEEVDEYTCMKSLAETEPSEWKGTMCYKCSKCYNAGMHVALMECFPGCLEKMACKIPDPEEMHVDHDFGDMDGPSYYYDPAMGGMHLKDKQNHTTGAKPEFGLKVKQQNPMPGEERKMPPEAFGMELLETKKVQKQRKVKSGLPQVEDIFNGAYGFECPMCLIHCFAEHHGMPPFIPMGPVINIDMGHEMDATDAAMSADGAVIKVLR